MPGCPPAHARHSQCQLNQSRDQHSSRDLQEKRTGPMGQDTWRAAQHLPLATLPPPQQHHLFPMLCSPQAQGNICTDMHHDLHCLCTSPCVTLIHGNPQEGWKRDWGCKDAGDNWGAGGAGGWGPQPSAEAPTSRSEAAQLPATVQCGAGHTLATAVPGREFQRDVMHVDTGFLKPGPRARRAEAAGWRRARMPA